MTDQIFPPKRPESTPAQDEWKAQLDRLLEEYRTHYVLLPRPEENPRP